MSHWYCRACRHVWDDHLPPSMAIDATTPDDVVEAFVLPGTCPKCCNQHTDLITDFQARLLVAQERAMDPANRIDVSDMTPEEFAGWIKAHPVTPEQIIEAALAPPASTMTITDDTTDEELSAFIRGKDRG